MTTIKITKRMIIEVKRNDETGRDIRRSQIIVVKVNAQNGTGGKRVFEEGPTDIGSSQPGAIQSSTNNPKHFASPSKISTLSQKALGLLRMDNSMISYAIMSSTSLAWRK